jgi:hypothetical protein
MNSLIEKGRYLHYKGNEYEVTGTAKHSETEENMVIYFPVKHPKQLWVRPLSMFTEEIDLDGNKVKRFRKL